MPSKLSVEPTEKLAYPDLKIGVPTLMLCVELTIISILHIFAFPWQPYKVPPRSIANDDSLDVEKQGGFLGMLAFIDALNVWDLVKAFGRAVRWLFVGFRRREKDPSYNLVSKSITLSDDIFGPSATRQPLQGDYSEGYEFDRESRSPFDRAHIRSINTLM
jgi:Organic solute transporter Ostalpha